jgi:mRNA-degrading endonuclease RelE of RelBE toxin-antitoxin system
MTWSVRWDPDAVDDLMRLAPADAARVDRAVQDYALNGQGHVTRVAGEEDEGPHYRLYVFPRYVVRFVLDRTTQTLHVWRVLTRARP